MNDLFRADYRDLRVYSGDSKGFAVDLSDNTNQWGTPPAAERALRAAAEAMLRGYPEPYGESLKDAIAEHVGVTRDWIVTGTGSDDILDCGFRALAKAGEKVAYQSPTFVMVPVFARTNGLEPVAVPLTPTFDADVERLLAVNARITYLCTPNNPSGTPLSRAAIEAVVDGARGFVVLDEAYVDFADDNFADLVRRSPRVLIARTFSKAFGLAGARIGYGIAAPELITEIEKARGPYKLTAIGERAARAAIVEDKEWVREKVREAIQAREWLRRELATRGISAPESQSNFLFVPIANASDIAAYMAKEGVAVRAFANLPMIDDRLAATNGSALRITVAPIPMMQTMLESFDRAQAATAAKGSG
jgi:histidinol-phosphate aminotransferase